MKFTPQYLGFSSSYGKRSRKHRCVLFTIFRYLTEGFYRLGQKMTVEKGVRIFGHRLLHPKQLKWWASQSDLYLGWIWFANRSLLQTGVLTGDYIWVTALTVTIWTSVLFNNGNIFLILKATSLPFPNQFIDGLYLCSLCWDCEHLCSVYAHRQLTLTSKCVWQKDHQIMSKVETNVLWEFLRIFLILAWQYSQLEHHRLSWEFTWHRKQSWTGNSLAYSTVELEPRRQVGKSWW